MYKASIRYKISAAVAIALLVPVFWTGEHGAVGHAAVLSQPARAATTREQGGPVERGTIVGWRGGNAVIYPTVGFFGPPQIFAVGAVQPDGSFAVRFPAVLPVDLLTKSTAQCATLHSSDPAALSNFTGNYLLVQHGKPIGATHSGSSPAFASFTGFANGDTRTGFLYADRDHTLSGFCQRTISFGGYSVDFRQNFDLRLHRGWNEVVAAVSVPQAGHVVADLTVGSNRAREKWFFFRPPMQP
jgi:hypothetical protein